MVNKSESRHYTNSRLRSAYQSSLMNAAVTAAKSGSDHKEGFKNFKKFLKTHLPAKGGWDLKEMKADDYSDFRDLRDTGSNPKRNWQFQHDILADLHSAQGDDFRLRTPAKNEWVGTEFAEKGFAMNTPFASTHPHGFPIYHNNMAATMPIGSIAPLPGTQSGPPPGGIMNTGSFYDLAINPVVGRERQGFGLGGYTVMQ